MVCAPSNITAHNVEYAGMPQHLALKTGGNASNIMQGDDELIKGNVHALIRGVLTGSDAGVFVTTRNKYAIALPKLNNAGEFQDVENCIAKFAPSPRGEGLAADGEAVSGEAMQGGIEAVKAGGEVVKKGAEGAKAAGHTTATVIGGACGALTAASGMIEIYSAVETLNTDHPELATYQQLNRRLENLQERALGTSAEGQVKKLLNTNRTLMDKLASDQLIEGSVGAVNGATNVGAGTTMLVGVAMANPLTLTVGGLIAAGAGVVGAGKAALTSARDYAVRAREWETIAEISSIRRQLGESIPQPCTVVFTGAWSLQAYATFSYTAFDGEEIEVMSCDHDNAYNWYSFTIKLEPGIRDLKIKFSDRNGPAACAVDRSKRERPWRRDAEGECFQEVFHIQKPAGKTLTFQLSGTGLAPYVYDAKADGAGIAGCSL